MSSMEGLVEIDYHVYSEAPEEDEYILARALADYTAEEENHISLEANAPVFVFSKHPSGWWTGECKGRYGLFPSNFVIEEFYVTAVPKPPGENTETDMSELPRVNSAGEYDSDTDSDDDNESDEMDEDDGKEESDQNPSGSPPIPIPPTHDKQRSPQPPPLILPVVDSFNFNDPSKLTPVSRQLGEFVDRINETRTPPPSSAPTTPTHPFATPPPRKKGSLMVRRDSRRENISGSPEAGELGAYDAEQSKLTPVSRQLGEFVERLNQGRTPSSANGSLSMGTSRSARAGEPIFNVFDGLLADIESLRAGPHDEEWDGEDGGDGEDVYNTPEAARARIAIDVKALREELEQANSARMSMESDIVRLREEFALQLEAERNGRKQLERQLSAKSLQSVASGTEDDEEVPEQPASPTSQISKLKEANRALERDLEQAQEQILKLKKQGELSAITSLQANSELIEELDRLKNINKELDDKFSKLALEPVPPTPTPISSDTDNEKVKLEEEVKALRNKLEDFERVKEEEIKEAKDQVTRLKDELFSKEREQLVKQKEDLMNVQLQHLSEREEERTRHALEDRSKQLDAVIKAHEEEKKRLETERDQAREAEATKAKEVEELKAQLQKLKAEHDAKAFQVPAPRPFDSEPKKPAATPHKLARSQPSQPSQPGLSTQPTTAAPSGEHPPIVRPRRLSDAQSNPSDNLSTSAPVSALHQKPAAGSHTTTPVSTAPSTTHGFAAPTAPHTSPPPHSTPAHTKPAAKPAAHDKPATPTPTTPTSATQPEPTKPEQAKPAVRTLPSQPKEVSVDASVTSPSPDVASPKMGNTMQRAQSHDAVPAKQLGTAQPRAPIRPSRSPQPQDGPSQPAFPVAPADQDAEARKPGARPRPSRPLPLEGADNSLANNALFQSRRLSTQVDPEKPTQPIQPTPPPAAAPTTTPPPASHPLRRTVSTQPAQALREHVFKAPAKPDATSSKPEANQ